MQLSCPGFPEYKAAHSVLRKACENLIWT
eukprot:gene8834-biopygen4